LEIRFAPLNVPWVSFAELATPTFAKVAQFSASDATVYRLTAHRLITALWDTISTGLPIAASRCAPKAITPTKPLNFANLVQAVALPANLATFSIANHAKLTPPL